MCIATGAWLTAYYCQQWLSDPVHTPLHHTNTHTTHHSRLHQKTFYTDQTKVSPPLLPLLKYEFESWWTMSPTTTSLAKWYITVQILQISLGTWKQVRAVAFSLVHLGFAVCVFGPPTKWWCLSLQNTVLLIIYTFWGHIWPVLADTLTQTHFCIYLD